MSKIISGGQTGADRAALDLALSNHIETGGYIPAGRLAEDGPIDESYTNLMETAASDPRERTLLNVLSSDATLIISHGPLIGGAKLTRELAELHNKPWLNINLGSRFADDLKQARQWLDRIKPKTLNIAGPRLSEDSRIYDDALSFLTHLLIDG